MASALTKADEAIFSTLGIAAELLERAHVTRVSDHEAREQFSIRGGGDMSGIYFPYPEPSKLEAGEFRRWYWRLRRDHPDVELGKTKAKYISPWSDRKHLFFPPVPAWFRGSVPIVFVESEKSSLAITALCERSGRQFLALGLGGCWGWRGKTGIKETATGERVPEKGAIPDLNIARDGRKTFVLLDGNARANPHVLAARRSLVKQLKAQSAAVRILDLPPGEWNGPDDYLAAKGDAALLALLESEGNAPEGENWRECFDTWEQLENAPPLTFPIQGFLQEAGVTLIAGLAAQGKTLVMLAMAKSLLEESPLFGHEPFSVPRPAERVLYMVPELTRAALVSRLKLFRLEDYAKQDRLLVRTLNSEKQLALTDPEMLAAARGADIFLDSVVRFTTGGENDAENIRLFADILFRLLQAGARTITGCHHSPKSFEQSQSMSLENVLRGSGDLGAMASTVWGIRQIDAARNRIYIENCKPRDFEPCPPFILEGRPHLDMTGQFAMHARPGEAEELRSYLQQKGGRPLAPDRAELCAMAASLRAKGESTRQIAAKLKVSKDTVRRMLDDYDLADRDEEERKPQ